jgi:porin
MAVVRTARTTGLVGTVAAWIVSAVVTAAPQAVDDEAPAEALADPGFNSPGSIAERLREDWAPRESLFQIPGVDELLAPWYRWKAELNEEHGLKFNLSATHLYQWASDTVGPEDDASGFDLTAIGTWTFLGRDTDSPSIAGFEFLYRDRLGTDIPPVALFTQISSLYPTTVGFADISPSLGQLWFQQRFGGRWGFQIGKLFPITAYDFFPLKNFKTDFVDGIHGANLVMPLPDRGLGGFVMFRPRPEAYLRLGFHDANADPEKSGFSTLFDDGELFTIFEAGFDPGFMERQPGKPPFGDVHVSLWHQDERDDANVDDAWGFVLSGSQRFGRFLPFLRYGYADTDAGGPVPIEQMVNGGVAIDGIFGQADDRIGIGLTWAHPADGALDDQGALDAYYRVQVTPEIAVTPILQLIHRHPRPVGASAPDDGGRRVPVVTRAA